MRWVSFLLLYCCALAVPLYAAEETLEERRERIKRKYLRERTLVYESDLVVEEISQRENEQIEDSEMMLVEDTTYARAEDLAPNPLRRPYVVPVQMRAAWMSVEDEEFDKEFDEETPVKKERSVYQRYEKAYGLDSTQEEGNKAMDSSSGYSSRRELFSDQFTSFMQHKNMPDPTSGRTEWQQPFFDGKPNSFESYQPTWASPSETAENTWSVSQQGQVEPENRYQNQRFYQKQEEDLYEPSARAPVRQPTIKRWNPATDDQGLNEFIDRNRQ